MPDHLTPIPEMLSPQVKQGGIEEPASEAVDLGLEIHPQVRLSRFPLMPGFITITA